MTFPFESLFGTYKEFGLVGAVLIGFLFGFVLERAGFGRATKLAGQFYLNDMTVFKVMFSAIVTAMLGLIVVSGMGLADMHAIALSAASTTYAVPMLVGGLLLGVGFIISGYCPGTSLVSAASGNLDGLVTVVGVGIGSLLFGEFFPAISAFYTSTDWGQIFLYENLNLPPAIVATGVVGMAIGGFLGAEAVERIMAARQSGAAFTASAEPRRYVFIGFVAAAALGVVLVIAPTPSSRVEARSVGRIDAATLARRVIDEPWKLMILDTRSREHYEESRVPGSQHRPADKLADYGLAYSSGVQDLVLILDEPSERVPDAALDYPGKILVLAGGFGAWNAFALAEPPAAPDGASAVERKACQFQASVHARMTGAVMAAPPPARTTTFTAPPKKRGGGCDG